MKSFFRYLMSYLIAGTVLSSFFSQAQAQEESAPKQMSPDYLFVGAGLLYPQYRTEYSISISTEQLFGFVGYKLNNRIALKAGPIGFGLRDFLFTAEHHRMWIVGDGFLGPMIGYRVRNLAKSTAQQKFDVYSPDDSIIADRVHEQHLLVGAAYTFDEPLTEKMNLVFTGGVDILTKQTVVNERKYDSKSDTLPNDYYPVRKFNPYISVGVEFRLTE